MADQDEVLEGLRKKRTMQRHSMIERARLIHAMPRRGSTGDSFDSMSSLKSKSVGEGYTIDKKSTGMLMSEMTMDAGIDSAANIVRSGAMLSSHESSTNISYHTSISRLSNPNSKKSANSGSGLVPCTGSSTMKSGSAASRKMPMETVISENNVFYNNHTFLSTKNTMKMRAIKSLEIPSDSSSDGDTADNKEADSFSYTSTRYFDQKQEQHQQPTQQAMVKNPHFKFPNDKKSEMTLGRRIALNLMEKGSWYYPKCRQLNIDPDTKPNVDPNVHTNIKPNVDPNDSLSFKTKKEDNLRELDKLDINNITDSLWNSFTSAWSSYKVESTDKSKQSSISSTMPSVRKSFHEDGNMSDVIEKENISGSIGDENTFESFAYTTYTTEREGTVKTASTLVSEPDDRPSLQAAWAYFEHVVLPRYVVDEEESDSAPDDRNEDYSGDKPRKTKLYSPIFTPTSQMTDFGIGTGLYFYTLRAFMIMTLIAGLTNIPNFIYFYNDNSQDDINWYLRGSAGCNKELNHGADDNDCDRGNARLQQGLVSLATTLYLVISLVIISLYLSRKESGFQEDKQRVQDYSIVIRNPPADARDPEEWKKYFEDELDDDIKHHVTCCTVAIGNDELVRALVQRREVIQYIKNIVPDNISLPLRKSYLIEMASLVENKRHMLTQLCAVCGLHRGLPEYSKLLVRLYEKIIALASKDYPATNVFVTFETEMLKEQALSALMVASTRKNRTKEETRNHLFRKQCVLHAEDAMEPSSILWTNLNISTLYCLGSIFAMKIVATVIIVLAAVAVKPSFEQGTIIGAIVVASFNLVFPTIANVLTNYESHKSSRTKQISFYTKILIFSWVNTAVVTTITTPIASINVLPSRVIAIFIAELITPNIFQLADVCGNFKRHCVAPRMATQEGMNMMMEGPRYDLATRYMNMMKILFLTLWYCSVFPLAFFICSFILCVNYYFDRFSLMRSWKQGRNFGSAIPRINQQFFFPVAIGMMTLISAYFWAGMSFDSLCKYKPEEDGPIDSDIDDLYKYCNQNISDLILSFDIVPFLLWSSNKSNVTLKGDQALLTRVYLWLSVAIFGGLFISYMVSVGCAVVKRFCVNYKATMVGKNKPYRITPLTIPYIPKAKSKLFINPLIPCPVMDASGSRSFDSSEENNLTLDLEQLLQENGKVSVLETAFCRISCWTQTSPSLAQMC